MKSKFILACIIISIAACAPKSNTNEITTVATQDTVSINSSTLSLAATGIAIAREVESPLAQAKPRPTVFSINPDKKNIFTTDKGRIQVSNATF